MQHCQHATAKHPFVVPQMYKREDQLTALQPDVGCRMKPGNVSHVNDPGRSTKEPDRRENCPQSESDNLLSCIASDVGGPTDMAGEVNLKSDRNGKLDGLLDSSDMKVKPVGEAKLRKRVMPNRHSPPTEPEMLSEPVKHAELGRASEQVIIGGEEAKKQMGKMDSVSEMLVGGKSCDSLSNDEMAYQCVDSTDHADVPGKESTQTELMMLTEATVSAGLESLANSKVSAEPARSRKSQLRLRVTTDTELAFSQKYGHNLVRMILQNAPSNVQSVAGDQHGKKKQALTFQQIVNRKEESLKLNWEKRCGSGGLHDLANDLPGGEQQCCIVEENCNVQCNRIVRMDPKPMEVFWELADVSDGGHVAENLVVVEGSHYCITEE